MVSWTTLSQCLPRVCDDSISASKWDTVPSKVKGKGRLTDFINPLLNTEQFASGNKGVRRRSFLDLDCQNSTKLGNVVNFQCALGVQKRIAAKILNSAEIICYLAFLLV